MKKLTTCIFTLLLLFCLPLGALAESYLVPGGQLLGITVEDGSFVIAGFDNRYGQAALESGLQIGDSILKVNGKPLTSLTDLTDTLNRADGKISLTVCRSGKELLLYSFLIVPYEKASFPGQFFRWRTVYKQNMQLVQTMPQLP